MNKWEKELGIEYPNCGMCGKCCTAATPSSPPITMIKKAGEGDSNARDFLNIFKPYNSIEEIREIYPELVERAIKFAITSPKYGSTNQVMFFKCIYLNDKNQCLVYEDRPQLCRDYPDTPFQLMHEGCTFTDWSISCKKKYFQLSNELKILKKLREILRESYQNSSTKEQAPIYSKFIMPLNFSWII